MKNSFASLLAAAILACCSWQAEAAPMEEYGTTASNVFFYYEDLPGASDFYTRIMGFRIVADYGSAQILQVADKSFITLVDHESGMHSADDPKTTAIALVTEQLDEWWDYISTQDVTLRTKEYKTDPGRPHHGFVAVDPEGYFLEFERFNPHPENHKLMPVLNSTDTLFAAEESSVPPGLGFKATVVWFYYKDMAAIQEFYEQQLGFDLIVDQGWAKIYPTGPTGYFGLVDETLGMHNFTEKKAVTLSLITGDLDGWYESLTGNEAVTLRSKEISVTDRYRAFVAIDPEGYFLEWDIFRETPVNTRLVDAIGSR